MQDQSIKEKAKREKDTSRLTVWYILEVLKNHSDDLNTLTTKRVKELLEKDFNIKLETKYVGLYLNELYDNEYKGIKIGCAERRIRKVKVNGQEEEQELRSGWYYNHDISALEFTYFVDRLLFSKYIPPKQCEELIKTLEKLSNERFETRSRIPYYSSTEKDFLLYALEEVSYAIDKGWKIRFKFNVYGTDKKLNPIKNKDGTDKIYTVSPYEIAVKNERYYMICAMDATEKYDNKNFLHFRLDYMDGIEILKERRRRLSEILVYGKEFNLHEYMKGRIYMNTGNKITVTFRISPLMISPVVDWLGHDFVITEVTDDYVTIRADVIDEDMFYWALQYGLSVEVLTPENLRDRIRTAIEDIRKKYK